MKKKLTALFLAMVMCMTMSAPAFAVETMVEDDPYAELKASIYRQLEAQNALHHYEIHVAALIPQESNVAPMSVTAGPWNAPDGGVLTYSYDWTYRDESGYVENEISYMDKNATLAYQAGEYGTWSALLFAVLGVAAGDTIFNPILGAMSIGDAGQTVASRLSIDAADGYGKVSVAYDSISGAESEVAVGWDTYPTVTLNWSSAYDISFQYAQ